jgi:hypothetical protein
MRRKLITVCLATLIPMVLFPQQQLNPDYASYIDKYKAVAVREMKVFHIPASITLAQGIIESNCGKSPLATEANNHFGVKCHKDWTGETYFFDDDEKQECFRKYSSAEESYRDHSLFLAKKQRYAALFSLDLSDYTGWAMGLKQAGYATNPDYPRLLIHMIEMNKLFLFDDTTLNLDLANNASKEIIPENLADDHENNYAQTVKSGLFGQHYVMPDPAQYEQIKVSKLGRAVYENNGIPFIFVKVGDTWYNIASEFGIYAFQVYQDNDMNESDKLSIGQIIYLEPKKRKSAFRTHVVLENETLFSISQQYGIKLKFLYKYNNLNPDEVPDVGRTLELSKPGGIFW